MNLHVYLLAMMLSLPRAWPDRDEPDDLREARLSQLAGEVVAAVEGEPNALRHGALLVALGFFESSLTSQPRLLGSQDAGLAHGPWQLHGPDTDLGRLPCGAWTTCAKATRLAQRYLAAHPYTEQPPWTATAFPLTARAEAPTAGAAHAPPLEP